MSKDLDHITLRSEEVQEVLSSPPGWLVRWGITSIFLIVVLLIFISWFVKYPDIISAKVLITTQKPPEKIKARANGRIEHLFVKNHEDVVNQQSLGLIENTANYKDVIRLKMIIDTLKIKYKNFSFPFEKFGNSTLGEIGQSYALFEQSYTTYQLNRDLEPYSAEVLAGENTYLELKARLEVAVWQQRLENEELELRKKDLKRQESFFKEGIIASADYETKQLAYMQADRIFKNNQVVISQLKDQISNIQKVLNVASINRIIDNAGYLQNVVIGYNNLKEALKIWEMNYLLKSSISGKVSFQQYWGENQFVEAGENVMIILPSNSDLFAKLTTPPQNTGNIKVGQKVLIKLTNFPYQQFGVIQGIVKNISIFSDDNGDYVVIVALPNGLSTSYDKNLNFTQELQGTAEIITEDLRLIERLFYQFRKILQYQ